MTEQVFSGYSLTSRFTLLPQPVVAPGKCAVCGAVDKPVVDFNMTIEFYGAILICANCIREAASGVGMVSESDLIDSQKELAQSVEEHLANRNMRAVSNDFLYTLNGILTSVSDYILPSSDSDSDVVGEQTTPAEPTLFDDSATDELDSTTDESSAVGSIAEDNNAAVGEGPVSVPASNEHGSNVFDL
jgi:hypothetical protein